MSQVFVIPDTILERSGWYQSGIKRDILGVEYVVMHLVAPAEYDEAGNRLPAPFEGLWYHESGENVGNAVVFNHTFYL